MALPEDRTIPAEKFPEKVQRFVGPKAPPPMKMMLARGMVPMKPLVQVCALYQIAQTDDAELRTTAVGTLRKLPANTVIGIAKQPLLPVVLDWLVDQYADAEEVVRAVLLNKQTDVDTLVRVAGKADEEICELLARNQARLLESPALVKALYLNRNTRASTADRVIDFAARNDLDLSDIPGYRDILAAIKGVQLDSRSAEEEAELDAKFRATKDACNVLNDEAQDDDKAEAIVQKALEDLEADDAAPEEEEKRGRSVAGMIRDMNIAQKVRLAVMGGKTERGILIRDTNKIVARSVIRSPAVSDAEAMTYAKDKGLIDEVIMYIAKNKKWTRHYQMKLNLVQNPKTPISEALNFLKFLRASDLRAVSRSRNVPPPIAKAAKAMLRSRNG